MVRVIKKSGKKQAFSSAKIKRTINKAAKSARLSPAKRKLLVKEVATPIIRMLRKKKTVKTATIRKLVLKHLDKKAKSAAKAWRRHEKRKKKRR